MWSGDSTSPFRIPRPCDCGCCVWGTTNYIGPRSKEQASDWVWIIDHSNQIGKEKCSSLRGQTEFQVKLETRSDLAPRSSGEEDSRSLKPFRWNPAGNQSRPVEPDQQPEASLAWWVGDHPCEA